MLRVADWYYFLASSLSLFCGVLFILFRCLRKVLRISLCSAPWGEVRATPTRISFGGPSFFQAVARLRFGALGPHFFARHYQLRPNDDTSWFQPRSRMAQRRPRLRAQAVQSSSAQPHPSGAQPNRTVVALLVASPRAVGMVPSGERRPSPTILFKTKR